MTLEKIPIQPIYFEKRIDLGEKLQWPLTANSFSVT